MESSRPISAVLVLASSLAAACSTLSTSPLEGSEPPPPVQEYSYTEAVDEPESGDWLRRLSTEGTDNRGFALATDGADVFVGGQAVVDSEESSELGQMFLASVSAGGALVFQTFFPATSGVIRGVVVDGNDLYVAGYFTGTATVGDTELTSAGEEDILLARADKDGNVMWARAFGGPGSDRALSLAADGLGNVYLAGTLGPTADLGGEEPQGTDDADAFLAKYDSSGELVWSRTLGAPAAEDAVTAIDVDSEGAVHLCGTFESVLDSDIAVHESKGQADIFAMKVAFDGTTEYSKSYGGTEADTCEALVMDEADEAVIAGGVRGEVEFDGVTTSAGDQQVAFVAHLDKAGGSTFTRAPLGARPSLFFGLSVNELGGVDVVGQATGFELSPETRAVYLQLDEAGAAQAPYDAELSLIGEDSTLRSTSVGRAVVKQGNVAFITGDFTGDLSLPSAALATRGRDAALFRITP